MHAHAFLGLCVCESVQESGSGGKGGGRQTVNP